MSKGLVIGQVSWGKDPDALRLLCWRFPRECPLEQRRGEREGSRTGRGRSRVQMQVTQDSPYSTAFWELG